MKKFLTVLLALSVVFTYSFATVGTAFADTTDPVQAAQALVNAKADAVSAESVKDDYEAEAVEFAIAEAKTAGFNAINVLVKDYTNSDGDLNTTAFLNAVKAWCDTDAGDVSDSVSGKTYLDFMEVYEAKVVEKDFELKIANAKAFVNAIDPADYIEDDRDAVKAAKEKVLDALDALADEGVSGNGYTVYYPFGYVLEGATTGVGFSNTDANITYAQLINSYLYGRSGRTNYFTADNTIKEIKAGMSADYSIRGLALVLDELTTVAEDAENAEVTEAYIENILANITYNAKAASDGFYAAKKVTAGDSVSAVKGNDYITIGGNVKVYGVKVAKASKITAEEAAAINNALMEQIKNTLEVLEVRVSEGAANGKVWLDDQVGWYKVHANFAAAMDKALTAIDVYEAVAALGADKKDEVNYIGEKMYSDEDIDEAVADARTEIFGKYWEETYNTNPESYFTGVYPIHDPVAVALKAATEKWDKTLANKPAEADKKYCADYYSTNDDPVDWQGEYEAIRDDAIAALKEVKTVEEVDTIMAEADAKLAGLRLASDEAAIQKEMDKYTAALLDYANEQWKLVQPGKAYREASYIGLKDEATSAYEDGIVTIESVVKADDLAAAYEKAKALFKNIKTDAELKAEAKAVNETVAALPATVTLANEKAFMDANDALDAYLANYGAKSTDVIGSYYALDKAMAALKELQEDAVEEAIRDLAKLAPIKADDKEAVQKVRDMYDAYVDYYGEENFTVSNYEDLTDAEEDVYLDEIAVAKAMLSKITTASSIEDVLAAKAAYDALSGSQQRAIAKVLPYKVELLKDRIIDSVESLKIIASSSAVKGAITVKWRVEGDAAAADGFQVYKSTKAQKGYTFMGKTQKTSMVNKKNLKKGTRYYYKVRAYVDIDGVRYYSDWSNKANRIAK